MNKEQISDDYIWYNKNTGAYAVFTAIKGLNLVTYFIAVPPADTKF